MADRNVTQLVTPLHIGNFSGGNYTNIEPDGTIESIGEATCWSDIRVSASQTEANGSNPPTDALFKNDGNEIPGTAYALSFLSTNLGNLTLPDVVEFDTSQDFTFEFWVRPTVATQAIECMRKQGVFEIDFRNADVFRLNVSGVGNVEGTVEFNRGSWNHVAVVHDDSENEVYLYVNNQLDLAVSVNSLSDNTNDFLFNRQETLYDVDYIAYWDTALTAGEIDNRYNEGAGLQLNGNEVGLKGLWELNDGTGTNVEEKTGIALAGTISGGTEGNQWDWIGGHVGNVSGGSRGVILKYFSPDELNELYFTVQVPHNYAVGTNLKPHIHWTPNNDAGLGERVTWGFEYTWANLNGSFGDTTISLGTSNRLNEDPIKGKHYLTEFDDIVGSDKNISFMMVCRIFRDGENDTYTDFAGFLEFDIHYEVDMFGSREQFSK